MKKYLLQENGSFYKANLHCHSTVSDGRRTPEEIKELYRSLGYSIVAYTDHDVLIPHDELTDKEFLALHGFEIEINDPTPCPRIEIKTCHICFIGIDPQNITQPLWHRERYLFGNAPQYRDKVKFDENEPDYVRNYNGEAVTEMMNVGREKGFFVTYNHPMWSLESYPEYMSYNGMNAFEIYNGGCLAEGYADCNTRVYDDMLMGGKRLYCIGADDNHNHRPADSRRYDTAWAWTMIKADSLNYSDVTRALVNGQFYASTGPEIYELSFEDEKVTVKCSAADKITCNYGVRRAGIELDETGEGLFSATFDMKPDWKYFRITVTAKDGSTASTNAYFADELFSE